MSIHTRKEGSTELETFTVEDANGAVDLTNANSVTWWQREQGSSTNKVSGGDCTITDAANGICTFDPVTAAVGGGGAFDTGGEQVTFEVYVRVIFSDLDEVRHPDSGYELYSVEPHFE